MGIALITNNILSDSGTAVAGLVPTSRIIATTAPLTGGGDLSVDRTIAIPAATTSVNGYLSSVDWTTFNAKQVAGNYIVSLTGEATAIGPGAAAVTLNNASVTGKVLTGVNITGGTVLATDTMLTAFGKLQNQINGLIGSTIYQGVWNASTNTPTLTSSVGTNGFYYIVNVAGSTNLNGITDWKIGDWAIFNGGVWQKVDNTEAVTSVNGFTGAVSLTTDNVAQGTTNLYFSNASARAAVSLTTTGSSGAATYNNTTGVFNIPNYGTALSSYLLLTGGILTGALVLNPANTAVIGLDAASDTFRLRSDSTQPFPRQLTTTMGSGTLVKMQAAGYGAVYVTDLGFYTSSSSAVNTTPNLYMTGGTNRVGINNIVPAYTLDVTGTAGVSGQLTLGSTITNGTFTYTLPGATGTLALVGGSGVGTVTSVAALTIGTTGTDLSSTVANSTTTPVITLNVPTASAANRGALSAADWTTFNNKASTAALANYLPLSGGTLTGALSGTSASFSGQLTATATTTTAPSTGTGLYLGYGASINNYNGINFQGVYATDVYFGRAISSDDLVIRTSAGEKIRFTTTGAATFSSSVTVGGSSTLDSLKVGINSTHQLLIGADSSYAELQAITQGVGFNKNLILQRQGGKVGIGTTSPTSLLDVNGTGRFSGYLYANGLRISGADTSNTIYAGSSNMAITSESGYNISIGRASNTTVGLNIKTDTGNVLIGTATDAGYKLQVNGQIWMTTGSFDGILGSIQASWGGGTTYPTLYGSTADRWVMHINPHISYTQNGVNGYTGTTYGSMLRMAGNPAAAMYWDIGVGVCNVGADLFAIGRNMTALVTVSTGGNVTAAAFFESSDKTIKTLIKDNYQTKGIESVVAKLYTKNGKEELGYYAQDVQGILPSAVGKGADGLLSLSYREVHTAKISALEKRVAELEKQLNLN